MEEQQEPGQRELQPTWLLIAWALLCVAQIWLYASFVRRDSSEWVDMGLVILASIFLGMVIADLGEVRHRRSTSRARREPAERRGSTSGS